jgi:hypothetical protein
VTDWWRQIGGYEEAGFDEDVGRYRDEKRISIAAVVSELGARGKFEYRYDMGDGWAHRIAIESLSRSAVGDWTLPVCVAGENACLPEDVGGPHGYARFLEILADRQHEQHEDTVRWIGGVFDPKGFALNRINRDWKEPKRRRGR